MARLRLPDVSHIRDSPSSAKSAIGYNTIRLVQRESTIPVPLVHVFEDNPNSKIKAQFMLINCLRGNAGMDLGMEVPPEYKTDVFSTLADIHARNTLYSE